MISFPFQPASFPTLAQANDSGSVFIWSLLLIVFLVLMFGGISFFRKWMTRNDEESASPAGFTLGDLRRLHDEGQLSDEEFEKARTQMIAATQRAAARAAEAAKLAIQERGAAAGSTDVDAIRRRAQLYREQQAGNKPIPPASLEGGDAAQPPPPPVQG